MTDYGIMKNIEVIKSKAKPQKGDYWPVLVDVIFYVDGRRWRCLEIGTRKNDDIKEVYQAALDHGAPWPED